MELIKIHVLKDAGILEYNPEFEWGNIIGSIKEQGDLMDMFENMTVSDEQLDADIQDIANELNDLIENTYSKTEVDEKIAEAVSGGQVDLDGYATKEWVEEQGYVTDEDFDLDDFQTKEEAEASYNALQGAIDATRGQLADYATKNDLKGVSDAVSDCYTKAEVDAKNYATKADLDLIGCNCDTYTKAEIDQKIVDAISGGDIDLDGYATKDEVQTLVNEVRSEIPSSDDFALKGEVETLGNSVVSNTNNISTLQTQMANVPKIIMLSKAEYMALSSYEDNAIYLVKKE